MASENIGNVYPTKIPGYDDAADIQAALRLYHYGSETYDVNNTDLEQLVNPSLAYTLNDLQDQIDDALANPAAAADVQDAEPVSPVDGFLWVQSNAVVSGFPISATSVYQNTEPTFGLADGLIWARANTTPIQLEIYDQTSNTFNEVTLPSQSGNSGKYLTTNGANPSWATVAAGSGMTLITNTSFSGVSAVNINNCFSSTYKNYKIMTSYTTSDNAGSSFRFRNGGSDITTGTYFFSYIYIATGTQLLQAYGSQTQYGTLANTGAGATNYMFWELTDVFANRTKFGTFSNWADNGNFNEAGQGQFKNTTASTFDGFSIYPSAGTITGSVQVYGLAN